MDEIEEKIAKGVKEGIKRQKREESFKKFLLNGGIAILLIICIILLTKFLILG
jgi:hypothetical protein